MITQVVRKLFGTRNERVLKSLKPLVVRVNELESTYQAMSDEQLRGQTVAFKERLSRGESLESIQPEAFAVVREGARRAIGLRHFDVQLIGGAILNMGKIAEMKTGEGKTLVASLSAYLNALSGEGVHVVTVNDYLARRDSEWMGRIYNFLGLSVGVVYAGLDEDVKRKAYRSDITYGQNNEFGFDYLRDNMKFSLGEMFQRPHAYAIVDEVDSILIDEARTPLIISGPAEDAAELYFRVNEVVPHLKRGDDFEIDLKSKNPSLTDAGVLRAEELLGINNLFDPSHIELLHHVQQSLKAHHTLERDVDYVVKDGQIVIVDEFTGRLMAGRRWSSGLHQAVEAKEGVKIMRENRTLASITFQNYFRMYKKLSGMTGTADTESTEFREIYGLEVIVIPTNRGLVRQDLTDMVFRTKKEKYEAAVKDILEINKTGQPVLIGTISIDQSEGLSRILKSQGITHNVLNAKAHEREAEIVAQAGRLGAVTIATNMAGRGTDILLGGNPEFLAMAEANTRDRSDSTFQQSFEKYVGLCKEEKQRVLEAGGLFIMGTERHESRRIDNQLRGRAGRQGDPGKSRFYVSLEDDLMKRFGGDRIQALMSRLGWEEGMPIDGSLISRSIESAQKRVEGMHFEARKHVTEYDDVMNKQRQVIYNLRAKILRNEGVHEEILEMLDDVVEDLTTSICDETKRPLEWDLSELAKRFSATFAIPAPQLQDLELSQQALFDLLRETARLSFEAQCADKERKLAEIRELVAREDSPIEIDDEIPTYQELERRTLLEGVDFFWNAHLQGMDHLREGIGLRGYGQKNPLYEYQKEGFILFQRMLADLREAVMRKLAHEEVADVGAIVEAINQEQERRRRIEDQMRMVHEPVLADSGSSAAASAGASAEVDQERIRLEEQKKERRKIRK